MLRIRTALICSVLTTLATLPAAADAGDWHLRLGGAFVEPDLAFSGTDAAGNPARADADDAVGFGISIERRIGRRLGIEFGVLATDHDVTLEVFTSPGQPVAATAGLDFLPISAGVNLHLTPDRRVDLYLGAMIAWVQYGDVVLRFVEDGVTEDDLFTTDNDFAFGAQIGLELPFGDHRWSFHGALRYLDTNLTATDAPLDPIEVGFDPLILLVGFGLSF